MAWVQEMPSRIEVRAAKQGLVSKEKIRKAVVGGWYKWMEVELEGANPNPGNARVMESMVHLSYAANYGKYHTVRERTELIDTETLPSKESEPT